MLEELNLQAVSDPFSTTDEDAMSFKTYSTFCVSLAKRVHRETVSPRRLRCSKLPGCSRSSCVAPRAIRQMDAKCSTTRSGSTVGKGGAMPLAEGLCAGGELTSML